MPPQLIRREKAVRKEKRMQNYKKLEKYSFGVGDRFGHQAKAQLHAMMKAEFKGVSITPVWNKSFREHSIIGTHPMDVRKAADIAVKECNWIYPYHVDADHINLNNVDEFIPASDFFTIDVADFIGKEADAAAVEAFLSANETRIGELTIPGIDEAFHVTRDQLTLIAKKYLFAVRQAGTIYRHIEEKKGPGAFITEVSMDETDQPQTPIELFFILAALAAEKVPLQTVAPKFTGRFNKGVDYVGDAARFETEFNQDLAVVRFACKEFDLPDNLKLSVHSGSDKFSIYAPIAAALKKFDAGLHLKTAGTTWLEELIGLAEAGGEGLQIAREIYEQSLARFDELCAPYATVIDIDKDQLPSPDEVARWDGPKFARTLRHDPSCPDYNLHVRQLLHVGYKIAAQMGPRYLKALEKFEKVISEHVTENLFERHIRPVFLPDLNT